MIDGWCVARGKMRIMRRGGVRGEEEARLLFFFALLLLLSVFFFLGDFLDVRAVVSRGGTTTHHPRTQHIMQLDDGSPKKLAFCWNTTHFGLPLDSSSTQQRFTFSPRRLRVVLPCSATSLTSWSFRLINCLASSLASRSLGPPPTMIDVVTTTTAAAVAASAGSPPVIARPRRRRRSCGRWWRRGTTKRTTAARVRGTQSAWWRRRVGLFVKMHQDGPQRVP